MSEDNKNRTKLEQDIDSLIRMVGKENADSIIAMSKKASEQAKQMISEFDQHIPIETMMVKIYREHGQAVAISAAMEFIHWFITERVPKLGDGSG